MLWIFLYFIIFNIPLIYTVYCVLWCLEAVLFSYEIVQRKKDLQSNVVYPAQPPVQSRSLLFLFRKVKITTQFKMAGDATVNS